MRKRTISILLLAILLLLSLTAGCARKPAPPSPAPTPPPSATPPKTKPDATTTASIVNDNAAFEYAISKEGTWIIATLKDLSFDKDLTLEGEFKKAPSDTEFQRKIALYTQDDKRNITARFTLTAPKLTIKSPGASIQHGTFKGDLEVEAKDFKLVDTTVDGNIYFKNEEAKSTFSMDKDSKVTGKQEMAQ